MVRHSMKILASSAVLSEKHWPKERFVLFEEKAILVPLRIKKEKKFHNPCALFEETFFFFGCCFKTFNSTTGICSASIACRFTPLCVGRAVVPGELCNSLSGCEERAARCHGEDGTDRGVCVLARLRPSDCGAGRDCVRLGMQMVALGLLGRSWCCRYWEL